MTRGPVVTVLLVASAAACTGGPTTARGPGGDCALVVQWQGRTYELGLYALKTQKVDAATVSTPAVGQSLGQGVQEGCAEGRSTSSAAPIGLFAIPGVSPSEAVTTEERSLLIVHGGRIPKRLIQAK